MKRQLNNDITRCFGRGCDKREQCQRYKTMALDMDGSYSYMYSMKKTHLAECNSFKEDK